MSNDITPEFQTKDLKGRFHERDSRRKGIVDLARACSALTIPTLMPPEGHNVNDALPTPYQGLGARAVQNLASKLLLTLLPPNSPFFKFGLDTMMLEEMKEQLGEEGIETQVNSKLRKLEEIIAKYIEESALRVVIFRALKYLIVTGNALLDLSDERGRVYRMDHYILRRDSLGQPVEIIYREVIDITEVPEEMVGSVSANTQTTNGKEGLEMYTGMIWNGLIWEFSQEINGVEVPGSRATYPKGKLPYIPLAWNRNDGDDWGTGHVQDNIGDFNSYEGLRKAITEGALAAARLVFMVDPNGMTDVGELQRTRNGGFCAGRREDIEAIQVDKGADFRVAQEEARKIEEQIGHGFLMMQSIQRAGERVTAEEIRIMAQELEDTLGGIYSVLALELQLPTVNILMAQLTRRKKLPHLPKGLSPTITTGFEALGRGHDLRKLETFIQYLSPLGPEVIKERINVGDYATRLGTGLGLSTDGLVYTEDQVATNKSQEMMMMMAQQGMGAAVGPMANAAAGAMVGQPEG